MSTQIARARWKARHAGVAVLRQAIRLVHPRSLWRIAFAILRGIGRGLALLFLYVQARDLADLRAKNPQRWHDTVKERARATLITAVVALTGCAVLVARWPAAAYLLALALLSGLFLLGRNGKVLVDAPELSAAAPMEQVIRQAIVDAGIAKGIETVRLVDPVQRAGDAWTTRAELPAGQTYRKAVKRRAELASALGVGVVQLDLVPVTGNERQIEIWCASKDPYTKPAVVSPLVKRPRPVDLWSPVPVGLDARGQEVKVPLVFAGALIGGLPRQGKTVSANNLLIAALLDVHVELWLGDGKGLDSRPILPLARRTADRRPSSLARLLDLLEEEMESRYVRLRELGLDKLNRAVCHAEMPLIVLWVDELRHYTDSPDKALSKEISGRLIELASVGPSAGIIPIFATQRPSAEVVPTDLRDLIPIRWAVRSSTAASSDMILGQGAASRGANSAELAPEHKGVGILVGVADRPITVRSYLVAIDEVELVAVYARKLRQAAGVLPGRDRRQVPQILAAMLAAMLAGEGVDRMPTAALIDVLREANAAQWGDLDGAELAKLVRPYGLKPRQLGGDGNPRGYRLDDVQEAIRRAE